VIGAFAVARDITKVKRQKTLCRPCSEGNNIGKPDSGSRMLVGKPPDLY
jgi:hypothetical protein